MRIAFDPNKRGATLGERGIDFADAARVFSGPVADVPDTRFAYPEPRVVTFGFLETRMVAVRLDPDSGWGQDRLDGESQCREQKRYGERLGVHRRL